MGDMTAGSSTSASGGSVADSFNPTPTQSTDYLSSGREPLLALLSRINDSAVLHFMYEAMCENDGPRRELATAFMFPLLLDILKSMPSTNTPNSKKSASLVARQHAVFVRFHNTYIEKGQTAFATMPAPLPTPVSSLDSSNIAYVARSVLWLLSGNIPPTGSVITCWADCITRAGADDLALAMMHPQFILSALVNVLEVCDGAARQRRDYTAVTSVLTSKEKLMTLAHSEGLWEAGF